MTMVNVKSTSAACQAMQFLASQEPDWSLDKRRAGAIALRHLPAPGPKDEDWRHTDLRHFEVPAEYLTPTADFRGSNETTVRFTTLSANGEGAGVPATMVAQSMSQALREESTLQSFFFLDNSHQRDYFGALNAAWRNGGAWFDVPRNTVIDDVVKAEHQSQGALSCPHSIVRLESGSRASLIEHFRGNDEKRKSFATLELHLAANASLQYALILDGGIQTNALVNLHVYLQEGAQAEIFVMTIGGNDNKVFFNSDIIGSNASCKVYGLTYVDGDQRFAVNLLQKHHVQHTMSDALYHCALAGQARTVFSGNIDVCQAAQKSDAYQKNRNLLISPHAHAYSQPQLEIVADDVRCTHGANFTSYDPEQQFYLQSRGIAPEEAKRLIVSGFLHEIIGHFTNENGRFFLGYLLNKRLGEEWLSFSDEQ